MSGLNNNEEKRLNIEERRQIEDRREITELREENEELRKENRRLQEKRRQGDSGFFDGLFVLSLSVFVLMVILYFIMDNSLPITGLFKYEIWKMRSGVTITMIVSGVLFGVSSYMKEK
jgi:hypothetical protein